MDTKLTDEERFQILRDAHSLEFQLYNYQLTLREPYSSECKELGDVDDAALNEY